MLTLMRWPTRSLPASQEGRGLVRTLARVPLDLSPILIRHTTTIIIYLSSMSLTVSQSPPSPPLEYPQGNTRRGRSRRNIPALLPAPNPFQPRHHTKLPSLPSPNTTACLRHRNSSSRRRALHVQTQRPAVSQVSVLAVAGSVGKTVKLVYSWPPVETDIPFPLFTLTLDIYPSACCYTFPLSRSHPRRFGCPDFFLLYSFPCLMYPFLVLYSLHCCTPISQVILLLHMLNHYGKGGEIYAKAALAPVSSTSNST